MTASTMIVLASSLALVGPLRPAQPGASPIVIVGKFDTATEHLLIPVAFGGSPVWCALDTGFSALIAIDREKAGTIGLRTSAPAALPDGTPPKTTDDGATTTVAVGPVPLGSRDVIVRDLPDEAPDMECVFGAAALRQFVIEMDYERPSVKLIPHQSYSPASGFVEIPLEFRSNPNVPFVRVSFRFADGTEQPAQLLADTGTANFAALVVDPAAARMRPVLGTTAQVTETPMGPSGPLKISAARPAAMMVGPITIEQPVIALLESDFGSGGFDDGLLGAGFFQRFTLVFDFDGRRMFVRPNNRRTETHAFDASGAGSRHDRGIFVVDRVLADTAADRAGLRVGDAIVSVDGTPATQFTHVAMRKTLSAPGETRTLAIRRDGAAITITLRLTKRL